MKILKLVLIALVTVSIYSFTKNDQNDESSINKKLNNYTCITFTFKKFQNNEDYRTKVRKQLENSQYIQLIGLRSVSPDGRTETWNINYIGPTAHPTELTQTEDPDETKDYSVQSYNFHYCDFQFN